MAVTKEQVAKLYVATFNRAPDAAGLDYWMADSDNINTIASNMLLNPEANTIGSMTDAAYIVSLYSNLFGRTIAEDSADSTYWVDALAAGDVSRSTIIQALINGAEADTGNADDAAILANKTEVAVYFADQGLNDTTQAADVMTGVTKDSTTVNSAKSSIDTYVAAAEKTDADAIALTVTADVIAGTTGDDTINGYIGQNAISGANQDTFSSIDIIDGGAGSDTLNAQVSSATNGATVANVEKINLTNFVANHVYSMGNTSGVETFTNVNSIGNVEMQAVAESFDLVVKNINNKITEATFNTDVFSGTTDEYNLTLSNASNNAEINLASAAAETIETLNITSSGSANKVQLQADNGTNGIVAAGNDLLAATKTLNISGDQNLTLANTTMAGLTTVTSTSTGNVSLTLAASAAKDTSVTTGEGDDKIVTTTITKNDSFDLGTGSDTLVLTAFAGMTEAATMTGIETMRVAVAASQTMNVSGATELTTVSIGETAANEVITLNKATANLQNVVFDTMDGTTNAATYDDVVLKLNSTTGTNDVLNINVQNKDANGNAIKMADNAELTINAITANGIETINLTATQLSADGDSDADKSDSGLIVTALNADKVKTLTVTADGLVDFTAANESTIQTIDTTAADSGVQFVDMSGGFDSGTTTHADTKLTINMGDGNDILGGTTGLLLDVATTVINTGAGNDTINIDGNIGDNATTVVDTVTIDAGAGDDTVDLGGVTATLATKATFSITLGDGVDTIILESDGSEQGFTIEDFVVGNAGDKIDLLSAAADAVVGGAGAVTDYVEADLATLTAGTIGGMIVHTGTDLTALTATALVAETGAHTSGDKYWVIATDGTDAALFYVDDTAGTSNTNIDTGDVSLIATLIGVDDVSKLTVDNFTDFLA